MKHIWVVTAWFPTIADPLQTTFVKEQVEIMSKYGNGLYRFTVLNPIGPIDVPGMVRGGKKKVEDVWSYSNPSIPVYQKQRSIFSHRIPQLAQISNRKLLTSMVQQVLEERGKPDSIWAVTLSGAFLTLDVFQILGYSVPFFLQEHSNPLAMHLRKKWQHNKLAELLEKDFPIVVVAERQQDDFVNLKFKKRLHVIPNPANELFFNSTPRGQRLKAAEITIITNGRLTFQKGAIRQVRAARRLKDQGIAFRWYWLGGGDMETEIRGRIATEMLEDQFILMGQTDRTAVAGCLADASLFVMSSYYENCPVALLEAQAMGVPCVVVKNSASEKVLLDGNGIVVEPDEAGISLAEGIKEAITTPFDPVAIRTRARTSFHPEVFYHAMKEFL